MLVFLLALSIISFLIMFICILFIPTAISEKKKQEGNNGMNMYWIPEMYKKEWYKENKLWVRLALIYSQVTLFMCFSTLYVLHLTDYI